MNYLDHTVSVNENGRLRWNEEKSNVDHDAKTVTVKQGQPIEARFAINTPAGGQWEVTLTGDYGAFTIDDRIGLVDGREHVIYITPNITNPDRDYVAQLKFVVMTADGTVVEADALLQDKDGDPATRDIYNLILPIAN